MGKGREVKMKKLTTEGFCIIVLASILFMLVLSFIAKVVFLL